MATIARMEKGDDEVPEVMENLDNLGEDIRVEL